jgi:CRISPR-associated protein Cas1
VHGSGNIALRVAQHRAAADTTTCLRLATAFVEAKIRNARTMLRRNHEGISEAVLFDLEQLARKAKEADRAESLLGLEGTAARVHFGAFSGMIRGPAAGKFDLDGRNRRPPKDPVNALLSLAYSFLSRDFVVALGDAITDPVASVEGTRRLRGFSSPSPSTTTSPTTSPTTSTTTWTIT